jgi:hypothetical protein
VVSGLFWRTGKADENRILVSRDNGHTWVKVWENRWLGAVPFRVDLTRWTEGEYAYQVKFEWTDHQGSGRSGLEQLKMNTWVELSPMALPRVAAGKNAFRVASAPLRAVYSHSRWDRGQNLPGQKLENMAVGDQIPYLRPRDPSQPGVLIFNAGTGGEIRELRFSTRARAARGGQGVTVALSISGDGGANWRELERFAPDPEHNTNHMWFNHVLRGGRLDGAGTLLKVAVEGGGLEQVIANTLVAAEPAAATDLRITHLWQEGDTPRTFTHVVPAGSDGPYELTAGAGVVNQEVRIEGIAK